MAMANGKMSASGTTTRRAKNRKQLLFEFDMQRDQHESGQFKREYFIGDAYPPSTKSIKELESTSIAALPSDKRFKDHVLFVRTLDLGISATGVHNVIEDENGAVERLVLYNSHATDRAQKLLATDSIFAVKEPYLEITASGSSCIRVDHPSDLVPLHVSDPLVPETLQPQSSGKKSSPLDWKAEGNDLYKAGNYLAAAEAFTQGLGACGLGDTATQQDLFRNRSIANTYLKRYETAMSDGESALIKDNQDERASTMNSKAYFRAGRAAYELRDFEAAKEYFTRAVKLTPADKDAHREVGRSELRLREQYTGNCDFEKMGDTVSKKRNRLDHASFTANVEPRDAGSRGNGLFATKDMEPGELILCEKALAVAFENDRDLPNLTVLDSKSQRQLADTQSSLFFSLVGKVLHSPKDAEKLFKVYDAGYPFQTPAEVVDDAVPVDTFRIQAIVQHNAFGCPTVRTTHKEAKQQARSSTGYPSTGLWATTAYTNHACAGNAMRSFIGDMIILRATRNISKDDEILMPYRLPSVDYETTQAELQKIWGFACDCNLCAAEKSTFRTKRQERMRLVNEITTLLSANPVTPGSVPKEKVISQVIKRMERLEGTYPEQAFKTQPRTGLVAPGLWLCEVYAVQKQWDNVMNAGVDVLRNLGYLVTFTKDDVSIDPGNCHLVKDAIDAAVFVTKALRNLGQKKEAEQMNALAKELYVTLNGEPRGFDEDYAD